ncbi:endonuclease III [candidate division KSB1 bacterium]|nr:MAG: endonuclease III [candidate division KSB1 bacterium]
MDNQTFVQILQILQKESGKWDVPIVTLVAQRSKDPFQVLVSTILSLRTKDEVTTIASKKLISAAGTPEEIIKLGEDKIKQLIYPVGFYKRKAVNLIDISKIIINKYRGKVPDNLDDLLSLPGVGRKTANLVMTLGFNKQGICVDTHVHRISNRIGYVNTKTPEETEFALRAKLPAEWWIPINDIFVAFGQALCRPISPWCSKCPVNKLCHRINVDKSR